MQIDFDELDQETQDRIESLGFIEISESVPEFLESTSAELVEVLECYAKGNYGNIPFEDKWQNDLNMYNRDGVVRAVYRVGTKQLVVKTRWNQAVTTIDVEDVNDQTTNPSEGQSMAGCDDGER